MALLEATGVSVDTVREWIRETGVSQVLIILDACRNDPSGRGETENRLTDSFAQRFNFDVRNNEVTAFATLYATDVGHVAYEYKEKKQGYFTWTLVEALKGGAANEKGRGNPRRVGEVPARAGAQTSAARYGSREIAEALCNRWGIQSG